MKALLIKIFWPLLSIFEKGEGDYNYKPSHRTILLAVGVLFLLLCGVSSYFGFISSEPGALLPIAAFFLVGLTCLIVGGLGSDRAVARIWGSK